MVSDKELLLMSPEDFKAHDEMRLRKQSKRTRKVKIELRRKIKSRKGKFKKIYAGLQKAISKKRSKKRRIKDLIKTKKREIFNKPNILKNQNVGFFK